MRFRVSAAVGLVVCLISTSGCGSNDPESGSSEQAPGSSDPATGVLTAGDVTVLKETQSFVGGSAGVGIGGTIAIVHGCVGAAKPEPHLLVFPPDTTVTGTGKDLVLTVDGLQLRVGDEFSAGTRGTGTGRSLATYGTLREQAPQECQAIPAVQVDQFLPVIHG